MPRRRADAGAVPGGAGAGRLLRPRSFEEGVLEGRGGLPILLRHAARLEVREDVRLRVQGPSRRLPRAGKGVHRRRGAHVPPQRAVRDLHRHGRQARQSAVSRPVRHSRAGRGPRGICVLRAGRVLLMLIALVALTLFLAFMNGANDVSKGIATLVGSGVSNYRLAVSWGTAWTVAGALTAMIATQQLVAAFSGKGLLLAPVHGSSFAFAVPGGAIGWLLIATRTGPPCSTTHPLLGALCGAGIASSGFGGVAWSAIAAKVALPLAVSPLASLAIVFVFSPLFRRERSREPLCVCVTESSLVTPEGVVLRDGLALEVAPAST